MNNEKVLHVYELSSPLDIGIDWTPTIEQHIDSWPSGECGYYKDNKDKYSLIMSLGKELFIAEQAARTIGFDGYYRDEPRIVTLPFPLEAKTVFVLKQENNGQTFVVSDVELTYLSNNYEIYQKVSPKIF